MAKTTKLKKLTKDLLAQVTAGGAINAKQADQVLALSAADSSAFGKAVHTWLSMPPHSKEYQEALQFVAKTLA